MDNYAELVRIAAQQGAWAVAAVAIFVIYSRSLAKREQDDKGREETLISIVTNNTATIAKNTSTNEGIVIALNELRRDVQALSQHRDRERNR